SVAVVHDDPAYARQAVAATFAELDLIEGRLSRFVESSDVFRINRLGRGQATVVHPDTWACLRIAREVEAATHGAFDAGYASRAAHREGPVYEIEADRPVVRVLVDGLCLDLGGIGKGFALDRMAALLADWEVTSALLSASTSTVLALDPPPGERGWPVHLGPDRGGRRLLLSGRAVSGSGVGVKGAHIIDPRTGRPAQGIVRAWAAAPTAAEADALSTAFLVLGPEGTREYCRRHPGVAAHLQLGENSGLVTLRERDPREYLGGD
ncbi:MAG: FAD:protein FMN transferase, partial [Thermoguttaceae bacterium]|nr:FAD:protein FMN transferase [Thermoguttaceae bacterium]